MLGQGRRDQHQARNVAYVITFNRAGIALKSKGLSAVTERTIRTHTETIPMCVYIQFQFQFFDRSTSRLLLYRATHQRIVFRCMRHLICRARVAWIYVELRVHICVQFKHKKRAGKQVDKMMWQLRNAQSVRLSVDQKLSRESNVERVGSAYSKIFGWKIEILRRI